MSHSSCDTLKTLLVTDVAGVALQIAITHSTTVYKMVILYWASYNGTYTQKSFYKMSEIFTRLRAQIWTRVRQIT